MHSLPRAVIHVLPAGFLASLFLGCATSSPSRPAAPNTLKLHTRALIDSAGRRKPVEQEVNWNPHKTAIIICDMWDAHWCRGASRRVAELAGPMNEMIEAARQRGIFVIHAPSSTTEFYRDTPQRRRAQEAPFHRTPTPLATAERWGTAWCWPDEKREPSLPIDDSDMGCDCAPSCSLGDPWKRQISTLRIDDADAITDNGQETWNLLAERGIDNVILVGVHLNMCVLGRPFAIRQLVQQGKNVVFVRDMTDTMYNSRMRPFVSHFEGTDLVVSHIERYWCPSITSEDLGAGHPFRFKEDTRFNRAPK